MPRKNSSPAIPASRAVDETRIPLAPPPHLQRHLVQPLDLRKCLAQPHRDARHSAVANDHVGTETKRHDRRVRIKRLQVIDQVVAVGRLEQPFGIAARLEPDERRQWRVRPSACREHRQGWPRRGHLRRSRLGDSVGQARRPFGDVARAHADDDVAVGGEVAQGLRQGRPGCRRSSPSGAARARGRRRARSHRRPRSAPRRPHRPARRTPRRHR